MQQVVKTMFRGSVYFIFTIIFCGKVKCQVCNLGQIHLSSSSISSVYDYIDPGGHLFGRLTSEKALDGKYYHHPTECAGSQVQQAFGEAWWEVTLKSVSKIYKINLVFRELYTRHFGYYVFVTNETVSVGDLAGLDPVYHDEFSTSEISQQNTIVFPEGLFGRQLYLYVNVSNPTSSNYAVIEPCEVEIYGCVLRENLSLANSSCVCSQESPAVHQDLEQWDSEVIFETRRLSLRCDMYFLSIMNLTGGKDFLLRHIMKICDGKQQCTINSTDELQHEIISFYCTDRCLNEDYSNSFFLYDMAVDSHVRYRSDERDYTAFGKSRVFNCSDRHVLTDGNLTLQCQLGGQWNGTAPVCNVTCQEPIYENNTTIRNTVPSPLYFEEYNVSYACRKNHFQANGSLLRVCNASGDWTGEQPVCKRCQCPCNRLRSQNFITEPKELQNRIDELKKELEVEQETLSATVRTKTCAKDERKSSKGIGSVLGIGLIASVLSIIICSDIPLLYRQIRYGPHASLADE